MDPEQEIRWGILSTGRIADWFAKDLAHVRDGRLLAVASRTLERSRDFARAHGIERAYGSYEELLRDPEIDVVYIGTPHTEHVPNATAGLRAGKAVLCEKPLTTRPDECRRLIETAQSTGRYLMEAMWTYHLPAIQKAKDWLDQGRIGALRHLQADFGYPQLPYHPKRREYDIDRAGGALLEMGVYTVAFAWLFSGGARPDHIHASAHRAPNGVEDDLLAILHYGDDLIANLGTSFRCKLRNWAYVIGEQGYIAIPDFWRASECRLYRLDEQIDRFRDDRAHQGFAYEAEAVQHDLRRGRTQSEIVPLKCSLEVQELMDAIRAKTQ